MKTKNALKMLAVALTVGTVLPSCQTAKEEKQEPVLRSRPVTEIRATSNATADKAIITIEGGLKYQISKQGANDARVAADGNAVTVHYTGWLDNAGQPGKKFDSSHDHGQPFTFTLGEGHVIAGWEKGVRGMKVGELRRLTIPAEFAYGARGVPGAIPPNATLIFDVELIGLR